MNFENIISHFDHIEYDEGNIEAIYRSNLKLYKYYHSDKRLVSVDELIFDKGILQNKGQIASSSFDGYQIEDSDFINAELVALSSLDISTLNYAQKIKCNRYKEYIQFKLEYKGWYNIKNRNGFYTIKRNKIPELKKAIYSGYFRHVYERKNDDGSINDFYYAKRIHSWRDQRDKLLKENQNLKPRLKILLHYNALLAHVLHDTISLFAQIDKYDGSEIASMNGISMDQWNLQQTLKNVARFSENINHNINTGHYKIALEMQHYCTLIFTDIVSMLYHSFFLNIKKCPLGKHFGNVEKQLRTAIDIQKLDLLLRVGGKSVAAKEEDSTFMFGEVDSDIKNIEGRKIFELFHSYYSTQDEKSKNYSFLWYAFKNDNYTDLSQKKWVAFLKKLDIKISFSTRSKWDYVECERVKSTYLDYQKKVREGNKN